VRDIILCIKVDVLFAAQRRIMSTGAENVVNGIDFSFYYRRAGSAHLQFITYECHTNDNSQSITGEMSIPETNTDKPKYITVGGRRYEGDFLDVIHQFDFATLQLLLQPDIEQE